MESNVIKRRVYCVDKRTMLIHLDDPGGPLVARGEPEALRALLPRILATWERIKARRVGAGLDTSEASCFPTI